MIDKTILGELKQSDIGKDREKTKERLNEIWKSLEKSKRDEIMNYSGLKKYTVERSYKEGNISAKLAVSVAEVLRINPFYLTGEDDEKDSYSEEKVREFLVSKNYGYLFEQTAKPKRKNAAQKANEKKSDDTTIVAAGETGIASEDESVKKEEAEVELTPDAQTETVPELKQGTDTSASRFDPVLTRIQEKVRNITSEKRDLLGNMPENEVQSLISSLHLRAKYDEEAALIVALTNLIITSM